MTLECFQRHVEKHPPKGPDGQWSVIWLRRLFEYFQCPLEQELPIDAERLINFLRQQKSRKTPPWQRHQAAVTAGRYQALICGSIDPEIRKVIATLADLAEAKRRGDDKAAEKETRFPTKEPEIVTPRCRPFRTGVRISAAHRRLAPPARGCRRSAASHRGPANNRFVEMRRSTSCSCSAKRCS